MNSAVGDISGVLEFGPNAEPGHAQTLKEVENEASTRAALADPI